MLSKTTATLSGMTTATFSRMNSNICDGCSSKNSYQAKFDKSYYCTHAAVSVMTPAVLGGVLGLSVIINVVVLVIKNSETSQKPPTLITDREEETGTMDIEMKPNSLYGLTSGSESIVTKPNEVYGVSVPAEPSHPATHEYVNP